MAHQHPLVIFFTIIRQVFYMNLDNVNDDGGYMALEEMEIGLEVDINTIGEEGTKDVM